MEDISEWVAEALSERGIDPNQFVIMSEQELLNEVLEWHGIIGFTSNIRQAIKDIKMLKQDP
jgi:hypothetical protein